MSSKTIAVDLTVYQKLVRVKKEGESFSRAIDRPVDRYLSAHTGADILAALSDAPPPLYPSEAERMESVVAQNRSAETWNCMICLDTQIVSH